MFQLKQSGGMWLGAFSLFPEEGLVHGVSTRFGGVSKAPFASLNMALHTGDSPSDVWENRRLFAEVLQVDAERIVTPRQVHGDEIHIVQASDAGIGAKRFDESVFACDALLTQEPDIPLMLCFADCVPLLFFDPVQRVAAVAHAGWKGTAARIGQKTVFRMQEVFHSRPQNVLAGIGPAIGACCFAVGEEVTQIFRAAFPENPQILSRSSEGNATVDLWAANRLQLEEAGLLPEHIDSADVCTMCSAERFYSYRKAQGNTGRFAAWIALRRDVN